MRLQVLFFMGSLFFIGCVEQPLDRVEQNSYAPLLHVEELADTIELVPLADRDLWDIIAPGRSVFGAHMPVSRHVLMYQCCEERFAELHPVVFFRVGDTYEYADMRICPLETSTTGTAYIRPFGVRGCRIGIPQAEQDAVEAHGVYQGYIRDCEYCNP